MSADHTEVFLPVSNNRRSRAILREAARAMGFRDPGHPPHALIAKMAELRAIYSTPCGMEGGAMWRGDKFYVWKSGRWRLMHG